MKEKLEEEKKLEDLKLTFKPKINEYSKKLVENGYNGIKIENRLINFGKIYSENKKKQNINNDNVKRNLTPINKNKSKIKYNLVKTPENLKNKSIKTNQKNTKRKLTPDKNLYEYLYLESKILKQKRDESVKKNMDLICPFKPKLNDSFNKKIKKGII